MTREIAELERVIERLRADIDRALGWEGDGNVVRPGSIEMAQRRLDAVLDRIQARGLG